MITYIATAFGNFLDHFGILIYPKTYQKESTVYPMLVENIQYSLAMLSERGLDPAANIAVVSSDYHLCRASMYMPGNMVPVAARMPARYLPLEVNYYIREAFGIAAELFF